MTFKMKTLIYVLVAPVVYLFLIPIMAPLFALRVEITQGQTTPDPIAIVGFVNEHKISSINESPVRGIGRAIASVISNDLKMSGFFAPIDSSAFIQDAENLEKSGPKLPEWRVLKVRFLLYGKVQEESGKLKVDFRLVDIITGKQMLGLSMSTKPEKWRKLAHMISDEAFSRITDAKGMFNTQIAYVKKIKSSLKNPRRQIMIMDLDGKNSKAVTNGRNLVMMPNFSPNGQYVAYLKFEGDHNAHVELLDLNSKTTRPLLRNIPRDALNFAPGFSPDSKSMVFSLTGKGGMSAICYKKLTSNRYISLTKYQGINTSPCFSNDGKKIIFTSNGEAFGHRCKENIFMMNLDGSGVERISQGEGKYSQPVWSPRGDLIAFTKQIRSDFYIGVMDINGRNERLIAHAYLAEAPSWSPNGRYVIYAKQGGSGQKSQIWMTEITGRKNISLKTNADASDCSWSPLLTGIKVK